MRIAVELVEEKMISKEEAVMQVDPKQLDALLHPNFEPNALKNATPVAKGLQLHQEQLQEKYILMQSVLLMQIKMERKYYTC